MTRAEWPTSDPTRPVVSLPRSTGESPIALLESMTLSRAAVIRSWAS